ncbi:hypothetical protein V8E36_001911, partial [Tilletia maclaganii]
REAFNELMAQPSRSPYSDEELFGVASGTFDSMPCCGTCADIATPDVPEACLPPTPLKARSLANALAVGEDVRKALMDMRDELQRGPMASRVAFDPLGSEAILRIADIDDIVANIGKVFHGLDEDAPAAFRLEVFVRSRFNAEVLPHVRAKLDGIVEEIRRQERQAAEAKAEAERRAARAKAAADAVKFRAGCQKKYDDAVANGSTPRQCETCRQWNASHAHEDQVYAYGH